MKGNIGQKAVLVYPRFDDATFWSFTHSLERYIPRASSGMPKRTLPPLGMMGLYGRLKEYYEEIELVDRNIDPRPLEEVVASADHVFLGGMIAQQGPALEDALTVISLGIPLVVGGPMVDENSPFAQLPNTILVDNEAEMVIGSVLEALADGQTEGMFAGTLTPSAQFFRPDFSSIKPNDYVSMAIQRGRFCPLDCEFCDITARLGRAPRVAPTEHTLTAVEQIYKTGFRGAIFFVDDNFIGDPQRAIEDLKAIYELEERLGYHFPKYTQLDMRLADEKSPVMAELREWFRKTNFTSFFIGVETNNVESLRETNKFQNLSRGERAEGRLREDERSLRERLAYISEQTGAGIMMGMIHGFDHDTRYTVDGLIEFINSTHVPTAMVGLLGALPRTRLYERLTSEGRLMADTTGNNSDGRMNFIPYNFSAREAEQDYVRILQSVYSEDAFFGRVMRELELRDSVMPAAMPFGESVYSLSRILTGPDKGAAWRHLPQAIGIAARRFGLDLPRYVHLLGDYFTQAAQYTHFRAQTELLAAEVSQRHYEPWQLESWRERQEPAA